MANTAPQSEHLVRTQFKPGNPGGPGRPRKRPVSEAYDDMLRCRVPMEIYNALKKYGLKQDASWADAMALAMMRQAVAGNVPAAKELRESVEGKATQRIELLSHEEKNVEIFVQFEQTVGIGKNVDVVVSKAANEEIKAAGGSKKLLAAIADEENDEELDKDGGQE